MGGVGNNTEKENRTGQIHLKRSGEEKKKKKNPPANAGDTGLISGSGRSPRIGNCNLFQYSCLENSVDRGAWQAAVHGVTKSRA